MSKLESGQRGPGVAPPQRDVGPRKLLIWLLRNDQLFTKSCPWAIKDLLLVREQGAQSLADSFMLCHDAEEEGNKQGSLPWLFLPTCVTGAKLGE
jgi:hypothetical protein